MPMYEFRCLQCGQDFEELAGKDEVPPCPVCHAKHTERLLSACHHQGCCASGGPSYDAGAYAGGGARSGGGGASCASCAGCAGGHCGSCH